jgi:cyclopropane-fatty-acyl-phospholipid synthase
VHSDTGWWAGLQSQIRSLRMHTPEKDAEQIQFHYDVSDDFYALWLDPRRVYSCAYYRDEAMSLAQAQEAKLDHICRKLMLKPGERFLDIGAGWGGLLLWAAEHYGVDATGITLSKNQHAHVQALIAEKGLQGRVRMELRDYRELDEGQPFDKISSVGMFEHVGRAQMGAYFGKIMRLLAPGGLVLNHGITAGGLDNTKLGAGMGDFIGKYIFPGGELLHVSDVLTHLARSGLEIPGRQRHVFRAGLDQPAPDAGGAAGGITGRRSHQGRTKPLPLPPRLHVRCAGFISQIGLQPLRDKRKQLSNR